MKIRLGDIQGSYRVMISLTVQNDNASLGLDDFKVSSSCEQGNGVLVSFN